MKLDHRSLVSEFIRSRIEHHEEEHLQQISDHHALEDNEKDSDGPQDDFAYSEHIYLGSPQKPITVADVAAFSTSRSFQDFRKKLAHFLNDFLPQMNIPMPGGGNNWLIIQETDKVSTSHSVSSQHLYSYDYVHSYRNFSISKLTMSHTLTGKSRPTTYDATTNSTGMNVTTALWFA